ncbi:vegetatible incompatibility het-E-1 [Fusarium subglutinans]|uniref:Vegetatible incompatibility het-E-1 n=1 Tax=Gibberella subglutinans TaxID=42677 RepID=A0A8H5Q4K9_GIBSU|nr:vegetatible incompatibility het-E-1 [Fusarium subglutinans]KAF5608068.1 vegetatible incompatibility het-E-1 [Fusarium subglutinans]
MNDTTGITTAAARLVGITDEAIRFFQQLDRNTNSVSKRVQQLESFSKLARDVELKPVANDHDDEDQLSLTKQILIYCYKLISRILSQLEWVDNGGKHTSTQQGLLGVYAELNNREVKDLFEDLHREQLCLVAFRNSRFKPLSWASESDSRPLEYCHTFMDHESGFLNLLFVTDPREDRASIQSSQGPIAKGTCTWIIETSAYRSWLSGSGDSKGLHIQGGEGHGKTMLAINLTEQLEKLAMCMSTDTVLYFLCSHGNINTNSAPAVLRGLIWQLCRLRPALLHHGLNRAVSTGEGRTVLATNSVETLWQIFAAMVQNPNAGTVTCVVDGLDECDESSIKALAGRFSELLSSENHSRRNFRILLTSQPYQQDNFSTEFSVICLDADALKPNVQDVQRLINHHVSNIAHKHGWSQDFQDQISKSLAKRAGGSFLWANIAVSGLQGQDEGDAAKYLDDLAGHINAIYERSLLAVPLEFRQKVRSLLTWIALAYYPLSLRELSTLTSDEFSTPDTVLMNLKACLGYCGTLLVTKTEIRRFGSGYETIKTIQFSHRSVKDYLLQPHVLRTATDTDDDFNFFQIIPDNGHEILASRCLEIMEKGLKTEAERENSWEYANALPYASRYWFRHLRQCPEQLCDETLAKRALTFLMRNHGNRRLWFYYLSKLRHGRGDTSIIPSTASEHHDTIGGLQEINESDVIFFEQPKDTTSATQLKDLQLACLLGVVPIARKILVSTSLLTYLRQANISSLYSHSRPRPRCEDRVIKVQRGGILPLSTAEIVAMTPIELTVLGGHHKVASLLLDRYPRRPIWQDLSFALATAVSRCDEDMVRLLIEAGAPKLKASKQLEGPICTAVVNRRLDVVKFLCCSEAKIWAKPKTKLDEVTQALMCLSSAADSSLLDREVFIQYAKVLLRGGASPDGFDMYGGNHGFRYWKRVVMEYLHRHGITLQNLGPYPNRETPLMVFVSSIGANSSLSDPVDAVQFLLDSGASINQTDLKGWTALHHVANQIALGRAKKSYETTDDAEEYQLYEIANLLLTAGIDQKLEDREKRRAADILRVVGAPIWNRDISDDPII